MYVCIFDSLHPVSSINFSLLGQLLSFTDQLFQGQPCGNLKWSPPPIIENCKFEVAIIEGGSPSLTS